MGFHGFYPHSCLGENINVSFHLLEGNSSKKDLHFPAIFSDDAPADLEVLLIRYEGTGLPLEGVLKFFLRHLRKAHPLEDHPRMREGEGSFPGEAVALKEEPNILTRQGSFFRKQHKLPYPQESKILTLRFTQAKLQGVRSRVNAEHGLPGEGTNEVILCVYHRELFSLPSNACL